MRDAVSAKTGQKTPDGFYNAELIVKRAALNWEVLLCGTSWMPGAVPWMNWRM